MDLINEMMKSLPPEKQEQAIKTNKAFREMARLEKLVMNSKEELEIATQVWRREDRIWKEMLSDIE